MSEVNALDPHPRPFSHLWEAQLDELKLDPAPDANPEEAYVASMGIYVFERNILEYLANHNEGDDFGKHIIPSAIHFHKEIATPDSGIAIKIPVQPSSMTGL